MEITGRWEKARYEIVNKIKCSLEGDYAWEGSEKDYSESSKVCQPR